MNLAYRAPRHPKLDSSAAEHDFILLRRSKCPKTHDRVGQLLVCSCYSCLHALLLLVYIIMISCYYANEGA